MPNPVFCIRSSVSVLIFFPEPLLQYIIYFVGLSNFWTNLRWCGFASTTYYILISRLLIWEIWFFIKYDQHGGGGLCLGYANGLWTEWRHLLHKWERGEVLGHGFNSVSMWIVFMQQKKSLLGNSCEFTYSWRNSHFILTFLQLFLSALAF